MSEQARPGISAQAPVATRRDQGSGRPASRGVTPVIEESGARAPERRERVAEIGVGVRDPIELLIRARYPVLYIVSWEEGRVEHHLRTIAERRNKQLFLWSVTGGLREASSPGQVAGTAGGRGRHASDPVEALSQVLEHKEPAIYLFYDLHAYLRPNCPANNTVIRRLREVARALTDSYKTLVICSPVLEMAPELQKDVTVIDLPLPGPGEIGDLLDRIARDMSQNTSVRISLDERGREALVRAAGGLTLQEAENVFAKALVNDGRLSGEDVSTVFAEKQQIIRKSGLLEYYEASSALEDVGGLDELKEWLSRRASAFSERARAFGLPAPKGALLVGVQGCGKSLCAKAVAREWNMPLLRFDVGRMFSSLVGSSEENMRRAIAVAESIAPAILWVDEIDKAFSGSMGSAGTDGGTSARVMSTFLTWLSEKTRPVFVLATANDISHLPPELLRKGRLDEIFFVDLPSHEERRQIFRIHVSKRKREGIDADLLAAEAEGFSGAEIEQAVISALFDVFALGRDLTTADVLKSIRETVPLSKTMSERLGGLRAWAQGRARAASSPALKREAPAAVRKIEV